ncbi:MAG: LacI family DNA-binding transcriptional regulator, partial [Pseudomonadota bacterium]
MNNRTTMADVAKLAGVSKMTVSKVIREVGSVSIETRQRVRQAIEDTGYMPNRIAGSLSTQTNPMVAVVVPTLSGNTFGEALRGIEAVLSVAGLQTLVGATSYDPETEEKLIENLLSWQPSGLILTSGNEHNDKTRRLLESRPCPIVEIWDVDDALFDAKVGFSHRNAGQMMAEHLLERGRRNFGFVGSRLHKDLCAAGRY